MTVCAHSDVRVLYFHHVGRRLDHYTSVSTADFERALDLLGEAAEFVDLRDYLRERRPAFGPAEGSVDRRRVALTFDDGYAETLDVALPLLEARGATATFFVVGSWLGKLAPHSWAPDALLCADVAALRDAESRGHAVASHSWSHRRLDCLETSELCRELTDAEQRLAAAGLGRDLVGTVAFPYGRVPTVPFDDQVQFGFATARAPYRCVHCDQLAISRLYLDANDVGGWGDAIARLW